ncbi:MAG: DUF4040 domain-containing protein [Acetobacteraceae bacterium]|nr:DUF4040 domain-containing protein [Acetobacteraceae bacterium]
MLHAALLLCLLASAAAAVFFRDLLKSAIALAVASLTLSILFFLMKAPFAAAFELSVAAGLVTVLFVTAISLVAGAREGSGGE